MRPEALQLGRVKLVCEPGGLSIDQARVCGLSTCFPWTMWMCICTSRNLAIRRSLPNEPVSLTHHGHPLPAQLASKPALVSDSAMQDTPEHCTGVCVPA